MRNLQQFPYKLAFLDKDSSCILYFYFFIFYFPTQWNIREHMRSCRASSGNNDRITDQQTPGGGMSRLALRVHTKKCQPPDNSNTYVVSEQDREDTHNNIIEQKNERWSNNSKDTYNWIIVRLSQTPVTKMTIGFISTTYESMEHWLKSVPPKVTANFGLYFTDICLKYNTGKYHEVW